MTIKVILVHGFMGNLKSTWDGFPELLNDDSEIDCEISQYGYSTIYFPIIGKSPSIHNLAEGLLTDIKHRCNLGNDEIILVGHSLGGLVIRKMLLNLDSKKIKHNIKKVAFFAVPHDGSGLANLAGKIAFRNNKLKALCKDSTYLEEMNDLWGYAKFNEKFEFLTVIGGKDNIVNPNSAKSIFRGHQVETNIGAGHINIVKPKNNKDTSYLVLRDFIKSERKLISYKGTLAKTYQNWVRFDRHHKLNFVADEKRKINYESLKIALASDRPLVRLTGLSGLGKTRVIIEYVKNEKLLDADLLIFDDNENDREIFDLIVKAYDNGTYGLVVIENCSLDLHQNLEKLSNGINKQLKIVTTNYYHNSVNNSIHIKLSTLDSNQISNLVKSINPEIKDSDLNRIVRFVDGFPLLAEMIATQIMEDGTFATGFSESDLVENLINGDNVLSADGRELLMVLSLFDYFPYESKANHKIKKAIKFLYEFSKCDDKVFGSVITQFSNKKIVLCNKRFARIVPKPLALNLATSWWNNNLYDRQEELITGIPDEIFESFCNQIRFLDSSVNCETFVKKFLADKTPFVQAELLISKKGSRLFRALVEVNPEETSETIYQFFNQNNRDKVIHIKDDIRRNLVVALEMLAFHKDYFEKSAWCLFQLALHENESWSNNATGMFSQLFRVNLSGTEAPPKLRLKVLNRVLELNTNQADLVLLIALKEATDTYGGSRTIGAEHQGTKKSLEEWRAKVWQEVFDYWSDAFDMLLKVYERGDDQKDKVKELIGHSIRGFVKSGRIDMLDKAIKKIINDNGPFWPEALDSIQNTFEFDMEKMPQEGEDALKSWLVLLSPDGAKLEDQLRITVSNPPWNHTEDENGKLIDVSQKNAIEFAVEISCQWVSLKPYLSLLLKGEQRQAFCFATSLAKNLDSHDLQELLGLTIAEVIKTENPNLSFISGLFRGLYNQNSEKWENRIQELLEKEETIKFYPDLITSGEISFKHLDALIDLITNQKIKSEQVIQLSYGSVTKHLRPEVIVSFCRSLAKINDTCIWPALNIIYMYHFGEKSHYEDIKPALKGIILSASLNPDKKNSPRDTYQWKDLAEKLLDDKDIKFVGLLAEQIIESTKKEIDYGDLSNYIKPVLQKLMKYYGVKVWPLFGNSIINSEGVQLFKLKSLLDKQDRFSTQKPSAISLVPTKTILDWCKTVPDKGPEFIASCINIFDSDDGEGIESEEEAIKKPSGLFVALLENFGNDKKVKRSFLSNIISRGWFGSLIPYLASDKKALTPLLDHPNQWVTNWVEECIEMLDSEIKKEKESESEEDFSAHLLQKLPILVSWC